MYEIYHQYKLVNVIDLAIIANEDTARNQIYHITICTVVKTDIGKKGCLQNFNGEFCLEICIWEA